MTRSGKPAVNRLKLLGGVVEETRSLFHVLKVVAKELHAEDRVTAGKRGVLLGLHRLGPQTVPQMAKARPVSRQHIQSLVNPLAKDGHVEFVANPAHRGSPLVRLTANGAKLAERMLRRESGPLGWVAEQISEEDLKKTTATLNKMNMLFQGGGWKTPATYQG